MSSIQIKNQSIHSYPSTQGYSGKTLSTNSALTKNEESYDSSYTTADWLEDNRWYYDDIMNGTSSLSQSDQDQFMEYWQYACDAEGLASGSSSWGDDYSSGTSDDYEDSTSTASQPLPPGAIPGTSGNVVYNGVSADVDLTCVTGTDSVYDIYSNDISISANSMSANISWDLTTDTRTALPDGSYEPVLRGTYTDPATGAQAVIYVHDYDDAAISVSVPTEGQNIDASGLSNITWEEYVDPATIEEIVPETSIEGELQEDGTTLLYDGAKSDGPICFTPQPGESSVNDVMGDSTITVSNTDLVTVQREDDVDGDTAYDFLITVTHSDGTTDVYQTYEEYQTNINADPADHITWIKANGEENTESGINPDNEGQMILGSNFFDHFTVNGLESVSDVDLGEVEEDAEIEQDWPKEISQLADEMQMTEEDLVKLIYNTKDDHDTDLFGLSKYDVDGEDGTGNGDGHLNAEELQAAIDDKAFPPQMPDKDNMNALVTLLSEHDVTLKTFLGACNTDDYQTYMENMTGASSRLATLLNQIYDGKVEVTNPEPQFWFEANDMTFDGVSFEAFNQDDIGPNDKPDLKMNDDYFQDPIGSYNEQSFAQYWSEHDAEVADDPFGQTEL